MTGAIEFLRNAKAIENIKDKEKIGYMIIDYLWGVSENSTANIVSKVMDYKIKEATHD